MKTKNNLAKVLLRICAIYVIIALIFDILIKKDITTFINVNDSYGGNIFSALCTIAALGSAILTIIIDALPNKRLGYTLKEIYNAKKSFMSIKNIVVGSLITMLISIPFLAFELLNTLTAFFVLVTLLIVLGSLDIWRLITEDKYADDVIMQEIEATISSPDYVGKHFERWYPELQFAIEMNNEVLQDQYLRLIHKVVDISRENNVSFQPALEKRMNDVFPLACKQLGFVDAYLKVICLNDCNELDLVDNRSIVINYIGQIQYCNAQFIWNYNIAKNIDDIIDRMALPRDNIVFIVYNYYKAIISNSVIPSEVQFSLINDILEKLCYLRDADEKSKIRGTILLYIFKYGVLENENDIKRKKVFLLIINNLNMCNHYIHDESYIAVISQIFRALYFYVYFETETIKEEHRKKLEEYFELSADTMDNIHITLLEMILNDSDNVVKWLSEDSFSTENKQNMFDYFPRTFGAKNMIWTETMKLSFSFWLYSIIGGYKTPCFPIYKIIEEDHEIGLKESICINVVDYFDGNSELPNEYTKKHIERMQICLKSNDILPDQYFKQNFKYFNQKLEVFKGQKNASLLADQNYDKDQINIELISLLENTHFPTYLDNSISLSDAWEFQVRQSFTHIIANQNQSVARAVQYVIKNALNDILEETLDPLSINFAKDGIAALLAKLRNNTYNYRNYTYVNDWAIKQDIRESQEYIELKSIIEKIPYNPNNDINCHLFLTKDNVRLNASITSYELITPNDEQCEQYMLSYKIADGKYKIDGIVFNRTSAISWIKKNLKIELVSVKVATNITSSDGFRVVH